LRVSRLLTALLGGVVIGAALVAPLLGKSVIDIIMIIAGTTLGMLLAVYLLGMLVPRANSGGVLFGFAAGLVCLAGVWRYTDIPKWWFGAFAMVPTFVVGAVASLLFARPPASALEDTLLRSRTEKSV
jgi:Na+/proline symporter